MLNYLGHNVAVNNSPTPPSNTSSIASRRKNALPAAYLRLVLEITTDRGIEPRKVLRGTRLRAAMLDAPDFRVAAAEAARIVFNAIELTGDPSLGLEFGLRTKPTTHGYLGYAAMSCNTLGDAVSLMLRFMGLRQSDFHAQRYEEQGWAVFELHETHDAGPLRQFFLEALTIGLVRIARFLVADTSAEVEVWYDWPQPDYFAAHQKRLPFVRFDKPNVQIRFPGRYLDHPLVMGDPVAVKLAVAQCEQEFALVSSEQDNLLMRVRSELHPRKQNYPSQEQVAQALLLSSRTLKRQLHKRGTSFRKLLEERQYADARQLLKNPNLSINQVGDAVGYRDPPSFTRAFKRWSGTTPSQFRQQLSVTS